MLVKSFEQEVKSRIRGNSRLASYADDFVMLFEHEAMFGGAESAGKACADGVKPIDTARFRNSTHEWCAVLAVICMYCGITGNGKSLNRCRYAI